MITKAILESLDTDIEYFSLAGLLLSLYEGLIIALVAIRFVFR